MAFFRSRVKLIGNLSWIDVFILLGVFMMIYLFVGVAQEWAGPYRPKVEIQLTFVSLLRYSFFSFVRVCAAYLLSLIFTFTYGYWAAKSKRAEPVLISLLDILQSVPVLAFMPGLLLALVNIFPNSNLGLEIATIIIVFTCEGWNLVFSFYTSVKSVPSELKDVSSLFHLSKWDILRKVEIPFAMNGLLWNSMLSMAGGWFYLMVAESFTLGNRDFRLPGIGSYMAVAYEKKDNAAIAMGIAVMFFLIIVVDRCLWAPLVAWSERFKYELKASQQSHSLVLEWLKRSQFLTLYYQALELVTKARDANRKKHRKASKTDILIPVILEKVWKGLRAVFIGAGIVLLIWGAKSMLHLLGVSQWTDWLIHLRDTFYTFLRVALATVLGSLWTVPLGVFIGTHPVWTRRLQPVVQVVASFPAPMVFPLITYALLSMHISLEFLASIASLPRDV
jgi:NitT/TauT family transport system permease protein